jgi:hypothetical protein
MISQRRKHYDIINFNLPLENYRGHIQLGVIHSSFRIFPNGTLNRFDNNGRRRNSPLNRIKRYCFRLSPTALESLQEEFSKTTLELETCFTFDEPETVC